MAKTGPRPTPTNLLPFTKGKNRSKKQIAERAKNGAVEPSVSTPPAPETLTEEGAAHWNKTAKTLAGLRVMSAADVDALTIYIESWMRWQEATESVKTTGLLIRAPSGYPIQNPMLAIANKAQEQCLKILTEFGLTPSSRTRVNRE